jgi:hypothetical protein
MQKVKVLKLQTKVKYGAKKVLLLINLVERHEEDNKKVKKYVWEEIAKTINLNIPCGHWHGYSVTQSGKDWLKHTRKLKNIMKHQAKISDSENILN